MPSVYSISLGQHLLQLGLQPVILQFGEDTTLSKTTTILEENIEDVRVEIVETRAELDHQLWLSRQEIFYVAHGTPEGFQLGEELVDWDILKTEIAESHRGTEHYIAACYSTNALVENKPIVTYNDEIDATVAAYGMLYGHATLNGDMKRKFTYHVLTLKESFMRSYGIAPVEPLSGHYEPVDEQYEMFGILWDLRDYYTHKRNYDQPSKQEYFWDQGRNLDDEFVIDPTTTDTMPGFETHGAGYCGAYFQPQSLLDAMAADATGDVWAAAGFAAVMSILGVLSGPLGAIFAVLCAVAMALFVALGLIAKIHLDLIAHQRDSWVGNGGYMFNYFTDTGVIATKWGTSIWHCSVSGIPSFPVYFSDNTY